MEENETQHHPADQTVGPRAKHGQVGENAISKDWGKTPKNLQQIQPAMFKNPLFYVSHLWFF